jgi:hypothetical protein
MRKQTKIKGVWRQDSEVRLRTLLLLVMKGEEDGKIGKEKEN